MESTTFTVKSTNGLAIKMDKVFTSMEAEGGGGIRERTFIIGFPQSELSLQKQKGIQVALQ